MRVGRLEAGRTWTRGDQRAGAWLSGAMTAQRHLAAILACDVVGYSRLMERDERGTLERLKIYRKDLLEPLISEHQGRIVKRTGDGMDIGGETAGLITYMRTDGVQMAPEAIDAARDAIVSEFGAKYLPEKPRFYTTKAKNAQEAHAGSFR